MFVLKIINHTFDIFLQILVQIREENTRTALTAHSPLHTQCTGTPLEQMDPTR